MSAETFIGVVIQPIERVTMKGDAFDETGNPTPAFVDEQYDHVIVGLTNEFGSANHEADTERVVKVMGHLMTYSELLDRHCSLPRLKEGKQGILEAFFDMGVAYILDEPLQIPRQPQA